MGSPLEAVTINHERAKAPRQVRISTRVRRAIDAMVMDGRKRSEAAQIAGLTDDALYRAMTKPEVLAYRNTLFGVLRTSEASRTIARAVELADEAESEHVRLQANTWIAGLEGISPIAKSESVNVHKHLTPGLTIILGALAPQPEPAHLIDGQAHEVGSSVHINRIGEPVPHPSMRNALPAPVQEADSPGKSSAAKPRGRGEKSRARSGPG